MTTRLGGYPSLQNNADAVWAFLEEDVANFKYASARLRGTTYTATDAAALSFIGGVVAGGGRDSLPLVLLEIPAFVSANPPAALLEIAAQFVDAIPDTFLMSFVRFPELPFVVADERFLTTLAATNKLNDPAIQKPVVAALRQNVQTTGRLSLVHATAPPFLRNAKLVEALRASFAPKDAQDILGF